MTINNTLNLDENSFSVNHNLSKDALSLFKQSMKNKCSGVSGGGGGNGGTKQMFTTDDWVIGSINNNYGRNTGNMIQDNNQNHENSQFIMMNSIESSEKSHMEFKLREENMLLRQEILKLKKALYMNNNQTTIQPIQEVVSPQLTLNECSPNYDYPGFRDTPSDSEYIVPLQIVPQPYNAHPTKFNIGSAQNTEEKVKASIDFPLNLVNNNQTREVMMTYGNSIDMRVDTQSYIQKEKRNLNKQEQAIQKSIDRLTNKKSSIDYMDNSQERNINLRLKSRDQASKRQSSSSYIKYEDTTTNQNYAKSNISLNDTKELKELEEIIEKEQIYVRRDFLQDNGELCEEKKRKSSVFEIKRHYEQEIENLKRDLEMMQNEELNLKQKLQKQDFPSTKEFTFKSENEQQQQIIMMTSDFNKVKDNQSQEQNQYLNSSIQMTEPYSDSRSLTNIKQPQSYQQKSQFSSQMSKHSRFKSSDKVMNSIAIESDNQKLFDCSPLWQPPSFSNSHINSLQNSPKHNYNLQNINQKIKEYVQQESKVRIHEENIILSDDNDDQPDVLCEKEILDTEEIDKIFDNKYYQEQFQSLDGHSDHYPSSASRDKIKIVPNQDTFNNYYQHQEPQTRDALQSYLDNSFCQQNQQSEQSSIAIVKAQDRLRQDNVKSSISELFFNSNIASSQTHSQNYEIQILESPKATHSKNKVSKRFSKDYSPSFGKQMPKSIYETNDSSVKKQQSQQNLLKSQPKNSNKANHLKRASISSMGKPNKSLNKKLSKSPIKNREASQSSQTNKSHDGSKNKSGQKAGTIKYQSTIHQKKKSLHDVTANTINNSNVSYQTQTSFLSKQIPYSNKLQQPTLIQSKSSLLLGKCLYRKQNNFNNQSSTKQLPTSDHCYSQKNLLKPSAQKLTPRSKAQQKLLNQSQITHNHNANNNFQYYLQPTPQEFMATNYANKSCVLDAEVLYEMRSKSALKRRNELQQRKENLQRLKLNEKLAKIENLQKQKEERRNSIIEKRLSKSPTGQAATFSSQQSQNSQIINYLSLPQQSNSQRYQEVTTPKNNETARREGQISNQIFLTLFNNARNNEQISKDNQITSRQFNQSNQASQRITEHNTPITSSRKNYDTNPISSIKRNNDKNNSCLISSLLDSRRESDSGFDENSFRGMFNRSQLQPNDDQSFNYQIQNKSTTSLFKKNLAQQYQPYQNNKQPSYLPSNQTSRSSLKHSPIRHETVSQKTQLQPLSKLISSSSTHNLKTISSVLDTSKTASRQVLQKTRDLVNKYYPDQSEAANAYSQQQKDKKISHLNLPFQKEQQSQISTFLNNSMSSNNLNPKHQLHLQGKYAQKLLKEYGRSISQSKNLEPIEEDFNNY